MTAITWTAESAIHDTELRVRSNLLRVQSNRFSSESDRIPPVPSPAPGSATTTADAAAAPEPGRQDESNRRLAQPLLSTRTAFNSQCTTLHCSRSRASESAPVRAGHVRRTDTGADARRAAPRRAAPPTGTAAGPRAAPHQCAQSSWNGSAASAAARQPPVGVVGARGFGSARSGALAKNAHGMGSGGGGGGGGDSRRCWWLAGR